jgi:hypothetical protein
MGFSSIYSKHLKKTEAKYNQLDRIRDSWCSLRKVSNHLVQAFLMAQGIKLSNNILFHNNKSAILLHKNGCALSSRNTRHINIRYFFNKDRIKAGEIEFNFVYLIK